jgi:hypothetical protein
MNSSNYLILKDQISRKIKTNEHFGDGKHTVAYKPYSYNGIWDSNPSKNDREAGLISNETFIPNYSQYLIHDVEKHDTSNHIFQTSCSSTFRCKK